jgi:hypothetical protein
MFLTVVHPSCPLVFSLLWIILSASHGEGWGHSTESFILSLSRSLSSTSLILWVNYYNIYFLKTNNKIHTLVYSMIFILQQFTTTTFRIFHIFTKPQKQNISILANLFLRTYGTLLEHGLMHTKHWGKIQYDYLDRRTEDWGLLNVGTIGLYLRSH